MNDNINVAVPEPTNLRTKMRDKRFVAVHRGGLLTKDAHNKLIRWARECSEHVLSLIDKNVDNRLVHALRIAKEWENDNVPTGDAMKASLGAHAVARESSNPISTAVARSIGQAVATAHMADHSLGAALYALKAMKHAGKTLDKEREWQNKQLQQLPSEIVELVLNTMIDKEKGLKI
ncbi:MAG TPA: hypothetical protein VMW76_09425 [Bacteroidales bacterium]|nr:hypothetical protein [Bacteroidales bacterium]